MKPVRPHADSARHIIDATMCSKCNMINDTKKNNRHIPKPIVIRTNLSNIFILSLY